MSVSKFAAAVLVLDECGVFKKKRKRRSEWSKGWLREREEWSHLNLLHHLKENNVGDFKNYLRMSESEFNYLLDLVTPLIIKRDTLLRRAISPEHRLVATLRYLATGRSLEDLKFTCAISPQALGKIIPETCRAIYEVLKKEFIKVLFVEARSHHYVRDVHHCEILLTSFDQPWGVLENPKHSLPPNTTCRYHFQGRKHESVWLSFIKYHAAPADPAAYQLSAECNARLRIWDGRLSSVSGQQTNVSLLGDFCKDEVPRLCDHTLLSNSSRFTRPCSPSESYVSSASELTLEQTLKQGSVLFPLDFMVRYEFVDTLLEGVHYKGSDNPCDRVFTSPLSGGKFQSPRSVFYYGRGGSQNLSCVLRFEPSLGERVQITLTKAKFGERPCMTKQDARTGRWRCVYSNSSAVSELWISEYPWPGVQLPRDCLCSKLSDPLVITTITSSAVEVNFTITLMNITEDFNHFNFEGEYRFISSPNSDEVDNCIRMKKARRVRGSSGDISLRGPGKQEMNEVFAEKLTVSGVFDSVSCEQHPWLIEPDDHTNNFLFLKVRGFELPPNRWKGDSFHCATSNRIIVYSGIETRKPKVICPMEGQPYGNNHVVEIFSDGWNHSTSISILNPSTRSFVVDFLEKENANYIVSWMEVSKRPLLTATSSFVMSSTTIDCPHRCPELNACISSALWCDGSRHCPSGFDEEETNCAFQFGVPVLYLMIGGGALIVFLLLLATTACVKCRQVRRKRKRSPRYPQGDLYMDGKDSLC